MKPQNSQHLIPYRFVSVRFNLLRRPKWDPEKSSLLQILVSIQGLILGAEHPYYLEPGRGGWEEKIREGDFAAVGNTLSGRVVREEFRLPPAVWAYEDELRVASLRYALLEPLELVTTIAGATATGTAATAEHANLVHLLPFREILHLHFSQNARDILESVGGWIDASRPSTLKNPGRKYPEKEKSKQAYPARYVNSLKNMRDKLEMYLRKVSEMEPPLSGIPTIKTTRKPPSTSASAPDTNGSANSKVDGTELLRQEMGAAAAVGNFILAGKIQKEIQELDIRESQRKQQQREVAKLTALMTDAALKQDYVTAGTLKNQIRTLQTQESAPSPALSIPPASHVFQNDDDDDEDERLEEYNHGRPNRNWGIGQRLNEAVSAPSQAPDAKPFAISTVSRLPVKEPRRLKIRLPNSTVVEEEFDSAEKLKTVYRIVQQHLAIAKIDIDRHPARTRVFQSRGVADARGNQTVGILGGAFAAPLSGFGFTPLSTHPKREYSLEPDGTKSLSDIRMAKFATLTVLKCNERGMAKRADLEDKLAEARGDAMDLDNLNYEALRRWQQRR